MGSADFFQGNKLNTLPQLASKWGFSCYEDDQGNWRIQSKGGDGQWYLQQKCERWLLVVNHVPQILFQASEASEFLERRLCDQKISLAKDKRLR